MNHRLKEIHLLKGKTLTREELVALEKEQIELENPKEVKPEKPKKEIKAVVKKEDDLKLEEDLID
jgi:hypothetical protein